MDNQTEQTSPEAPAAASDYFYYVRFRANQAAVSASSPLKDLKRGEIVMVKTDHGLEPAAISNVGPAGDNCCRTTHTLERRANRDEAAKYNRLTKRENDAFKVCQERISKHQLKMKLTRVERFFNGSKIIFYFTAENRVDFRELVKDLVQEFRTRVEIRQIGVRHETKMIGGLGSCGRELCCSSFIRNFAPVSIKMAKEQSLPLNPSKISGVCNRLLCCLTYEYDTYHRLKKRMPRPGKVLVFEGREHKVIQHDIFRETVTVCQLDDRDKRLVLTRSEWEKAEVKVQHPQKDKTKDRPARPRKKKKPGRPNRRHEPRRK